MFSYICYPFRLTANSSTIALSRALPIVFARRSLTSAFFAAPRRAFLSTARSQITMTALPDITTAAAAAAAEETRVLKVDPASISFSTEGQPLTSDPDTLANLNEAVHILTTTSRPVAFPTETVYGLGASALRDDAALSIYTAKNRPADNPLIVHVSSLDQLQRVLKTSLPDVYKPLVDKFWPGPLTVVLPVPLDSEGHPVVSHVCTHGQDTVAVRIPAHPVARALIALSDTPLAAPSANASTRPSPTTAAHVYSDLNGRIPLVLDGGPCLVGVESTVVDGTVTPPRLLRPGGVSLEQIKHNGGPFWQSVVVGKATAGANETVRTPGMKYKHYSPRAPVVLFNGCGTGVAAVQSYMANSSTPSAPVALLTTRFFDAPGIEETLGASCTVLVRHLGSAGTDISRNLFSALREMDEDQHAGLILVEGIDESDEGLAVMNRLTKAASTVITGPSS